MASTTSASSSSSSSLFVPSQRPSMPEIEDTTALEIVKDAKMKVLRRNSMPNTLAYFDSNPSSTLTTESARALVRFLESAVGLQTMSLQQCKVFAAQTRSYVLCDELPETLKNQYDFIAEYGIVSGISHYELSQKLIQHVDKQSATWARGNARMNRIEGGLSNDLTRAVEEMKEVFNSLQESKKEIEQLRTELAFSTGRNHQLDKDLKRSQRLLEITEEDLVKFRKQLHESNQRELNHEIAYENVVKERNRAESERILLLNRFEEMKNKQLEQNGFCMFENCPHQDHGKSRKTRSPTNDDSLTLPLRSDSMVRESTSEPSPRLHLPPLHLDSLVSPKSKQADSPMNSRVAKLRASPSVSHLSRSDSCQSNYLPVHSESTNEATQKRQTATMESMSKSASVSRIGSTPKLLSPKITIESTSQLSSPKNCTVSSVSPTSPNIGGSILPTSTTRSASSKAVSPSLVPPTKSTLSTSASTPSLSTVRSRLTVVLGATQAEHAADSTTSSQLKSPTLRTQERIRAVADRLFGLQQLQNLIS
eukprot:GILK01003179.1.p1 GENE.GILK01003179.1~~GILK01003179.1.p1  ORF type:complete len:536 (+),score=113.48 GILK01003179.1:44-1651(+)